MIKGGIGGSKTQTGRGFEERTDLKSVFSKLQGYSLSGNDLLFSGKIIAQMYKKYEFYSIFLKKHKIDWKGILSKRLVPDDSIFVISANTLFIIEMKFQQTTGSVDEKLQTCDFKKKQYKKLMEGTGIEVEYVYILGNWFKAEQYKDVLDYIKSVGCHYVFGELPLELLGLPKPV